jgi:hypothetical protein
MDCIFFPIFLNRKYSNGNNIHGFWCHATVQHTCFHENMKILLRVHSFLAYSPSQKGAYEIIMLCAYAYGRVCMCMWLFV